MKPWIHGAYTACLSEVHVKGNSNTRLVCKKFVDEWAPIHRGQVRLFGDATGGARKSSALSGSDWDIVVRELSKVPHWRIIKMVPKANPAERDRLNAVNTRLMTAQGRVRFMVDPVKCPFLCQDLESVPLKDDGSGDLDKSDGDLTHLSDGVGYKVWRVAPVKQGGFSVEVV